LARHRDSEHAEHRRWLVAEMIARRMSRAEVQEELERRGVTNPRTGRPYSHVTLVDDIKAIKRRWREDCCQEYGILVGEVCAMTKAVYREALAAGDYMAAVAALRRYCEVLDLDRPRGSRWDEERERRGGAGRAVLEATAVVGIVGGPGLLGVRLRELRDMGALDGVFLPGPEQSRSSTSLQYRDEPDLTADESSG
jgi:hypothetical protein